MAYLDRRDRYHQWALTQFAEIIPPMLTCESVISEACFLTRHIPKGVESVLRLLEQGAVQVEFSVQEELETITKLVGNYSNVPMSLADACLVRMSELIDGCNVMSLDSDFRVYRRHGNKSIPLLIPADI